jgi:hypothetical protein
MSAERALPSGQRVYSGNSLKAVDNRRSVLRLWSYPAESSCDARANRTSGEMPQDLRDPPLCEGDGP